MSEPNNSPTLVRAKCFHTLDAYVRLITLLVKHSGETQNTVTKVNLLNKVLGIVAGVLLIDHEVRQTNFQQVPYHRIFIMLFLELNSPDAILENINFQVKKIVIKLNPLPLPKKCSGTLNEILALQVLSSNKNQNKYLVMSPEEHSTYRAHCSKTIGKGGAKCSAMFRAKSLRISTN